MENDKKAVIAIQSLAFGGNGMGSLPDGKLCFVRGTVPGDKVEVIITSEKKNYARACPVRLVESSPHRIEPECPYAYVPGKDSASSCPGCVYAQMDYETELNWKEQQFESFFTRNGLIPQEVFLPPFASSSVSGYRNKMVLAYENGAAGYRGEDNRSLIPVSACLLARKAINTCYEALRTKDKLEGTGKLHFRWTLENGAFCCKDGEGSADHSFLTEQLGGFGRFQVPRQSFFQVNNAVACELIRRVLNIIGEKAPSHLVELYSGSGIFSILAAEQQKELHAHGVELDRFAVRAAIRNAVTRKVSDRCRFLCGDAGKLLFQAMEAEGGVADETLVLVDPPRTGLAPEVTRTLLELHPRWILSVSCAPDTLRRDLQILSAGYRVTQAMLLDMFPRTAHFETVTLLEQK